MNWFLMAVWFSGFGFGVCAMAVAAWQYFGGERARLEAKLTQYEKLLIPGLLRLEPPTSGPRPQTKSTNGEPRPSLRTARPSWTVAKSKLESQDTPEIKEEKIMKAHEDVNIA